MLWDFWSGLKAINHFLYAAELRREQCHLNASVLMFCYFIILTKGVLKMKKLQSCHITKLLVFAFFLLLLSESSNAQFADSLALFVVADAASPNAAENEIILRLQDMEFDVEVIGQNDVSDGSTAGTALVLISATVSSGTVAGNMPGLIDLEIPVINWEPFIYDALGFQATDEGEFNTTEIDIIGADHPLAAGLPEGLVTISTVEKAVSYGLPEGDVDIIAVNPNDESQVVLFAYDKGAEMYSGNAPARRVGTFLLNDVADAMTDEGWQLFDASVKWAMNFPTPVEDLAVDIPTQFTLHNNYPNPFNPITNIVFSIPTQANVQLSVWNALGEKVATLVDGIRPAGNHTAIFNASDISSGVYFYRLEVGFHTVTKKMLFLK